MKKFIILILAIGCFNIAKSQAVLEHTYTNLEELYGPFYTTNYGYVYAVISNSSQTVDLYDLEHNFMKTIAPVLNPDAIFGVINLSDNLFNSDSKIELLLNVMNWDDTYFTEIINEDNQVLQIFDYEWSYKIFEIAGVFRMITEGAPPSYDRKVYVLPGTTILDVQEVGSSDNLSVFPNPTTGEITIKYPAGSDEISIYSINGSEVCKKKLSGKGLDKIDVSSLPAGNYLYRLGSGQGITGSGKFTIK